MPSFLAKYRANKAALTEAENSPETNVTSFEPASASEASSQLFKQVAAGSAGVRRISARFRSRCWDCDGVVHEGETVLWSPSVRGCVVHEDCVHPLDNDLNNFSSDEIEDADDLNNLFQFRPEATQKPPHDLDLQQRVSLLEMEKLSLQSEIGQLRRNTRAIVWQELQPCVAMAHAIAGLVRWCSRATLSDSEKRFSLLELD